VEYLLVREPAIFVTRGVLTIELDLIIATSTNFIVYRGCFALLVFLKFYVMFARKHYRIVAIETVDMTSVFHVHPDSSNLLGFCYHAEYTPRIYNYY
jgi:hypothetical protein